jgi:hypothetical protein
MRRSLFQVVNYGVFLSVLICVLRSFYVAHQVTIQEFENNSSRENDPPTIIDNNNNKPTNATSSSKSPHPDLLLTVPFYVYDELDWSKATFGGIPVREYATGSPSVPRKSIKHSNDYWFGMASLTHPLRTKDPSKAKLFVVPMLMNYFDEKAVHLRSHNLCIQGLCNKKLLESAAHTLNGSVWFQRYPERHIVTTSHYAYARQWWQDRKPKILRDTLYQMNAITFENLPTNVSPERRHFASYLVGGGCNLVDTSNTPKLYDLAMIAGFKPEIEDRHKVCDWIIGPTNNHNNNNWSMPICGKGDMCPTLAQAKLGFHVRGDTFGSQRLMDTILSGTVPIFTRIEQYGIQPPWINWTKISYFINLNNTSTPEEFQKSLHNILDPDEQQGRLLQQKHQAVLEN